MKVFRPIARSCQGYVATALALALLLAVTRRTLEQSMALHMLLQFPVLVLIGMMLTGQVPLTWQARAARWNAYGITGLAFVAIISALGMVPRLLDLALVDMRIEILKCAVLVLCGMALRLSWRRAGIVVQLFFLGNVLPMMAISGSLYVDTPQRLCNAYRLDEQLWVGQALIGVAAGLGAMWLGRVGWQYSRQDSAGLHA